jgi:hypothetical protein
MQYHSLIARKSQLKSSRSLLDSVKRCFINCENILVCRHTLLPCQTVLEKCGGGIQLVMLRARLTFCDD